MKPFFSDKGVNTGKISLIEYNKIIYDDDRVAATFKLKKFELTNDFIVKSIDNVNPIDVMFGKYASHPSFKYASHPSFRGCNKTKFSPSIC